MPTGFQIHVQTHLLCTVQWLVVVTIKEWWSVEACCTFVSNEHVIRDRARWLWGEERVDSIVRVGQKRLTFLGGWSAVKRRQSIQTIYTLMRIQKLVKFKTGSSTDGSVLYVLWWAKGAILKKNRKKKTKTLCNVGANGTPNPLHTTVQIS